MTRDEKYNMQERLLRGLLLQTPWLSVPYVVKQVALLIPEVRHHRNIPDFCVYEERVLNEVSDCFDNHSWDSEAVLSAVRTITNDKIINSVYGQLFGDTITPLVFEAACVHYIDAMSKLWTSN